MNPILSTCENRSRSLSKLVRGDGLFNSEGGAPTARSQQPPWEPRPGGLQTDTCPTVTCVGSGGEEQEVGPTGPAGESEMVRARGEDGKIRLVCPSCSLLNHWGLASFPAPLSSTCFRFAPLALPPLGAPSFPAFLVPCNSELRWLSAPHKFRVGNASH